MEMMGQRDKEVPRDRLDQRERVELQVCLVSMVPKEKKVKLAPRDDMETKEIKEILEQADRMEHKELL